MQSSTSRIRWAAIGAAVAVTLGAGGIGVSQALTTTGEKAIYSPIEPCRLTDTRPPPNRVGPRSAPLGVDESYKLSGWGTVGGCTLPAGTTALSLNVTALNATQPTFIAFYPADAASLPVASNLNPVPGAPPTPNAVTVDLDAAGEFVVYNLQGNVNVIIDVVGVYDDHNHDDRYYTETEVDGFHDGFYSKTEIDAMTASTSATRLEQLPLTSGNQNVLSAEITTVGTASLLVVAAIEVRADGGTNDNMNCNLSVDGVDGLRQSVSIPDVVGRQAVMTLTQMFPVAAGTHTIIVECNKAPAATSTVESASLAAIATS